MSDLLPINFHATELPGTHSKAFEWRMRETLGTLESRGFEVVWPTMQTWEFLRRDGGTEVRVSGLVWRKP